MRRGIIAKPIANSITWVSLKMTFLNIEHFIPKAGNVKANPAAIQAIRRMFYFILRQPAVIGKGEFEFVPVVVDGVSAKNR
jgi:hypothetical protein